MDEQTSENSYVKVPTIRQVYDEMLKQAKDLNQIIQEFKVKPLKLEDNLRKKKITIAQVLEKIKPEQQLAKIWSLAPTTRQGTEKQIKNYNEHYESILQAREKYHALSKEQKKIYYLAAYLKLPSVAPQYKEPNEENLVGLSSFVDVKNNPKTKVRTAEKNTISDRYLMNTDRVVSNIDLLGEGEVDYLKNYDLLVHVVFYDGLKCEKQNEFICLKTQKLSQLVNKFECLIQQLDDQYYKKNDFAMDEPAKYFIIGDMIYYDGNRDDKDLVTFIKESSQHERVKYQVLHMSEASMENLRVIFGHPYLYRHLRGCDHTIIFKEARIFVQNEEEEESSQVLTLAEYPVTIYESKMKKKKCDGCSHWFSTCVSIADPLKNGENLFLCHQCYTDLELDSNGHFKKESTRIIPYIHD